MLEHLLKNGNITIPEGEHGELISGSVRNIREPVAGFGGFTSHALLANPRFRTALNALMRREEELSYA